MHWHPMLHSNLLCFRTISLLLVAAPLALGACASSDDTAPVTAEASAACTGTLDIVSTGWGVVCPPTFPDAMNDARQCTRADFAVVSSGFCGTLSAYGFGWSGHSLKCFYDPESGTLVGAAAHDSVPTYCDHSSYGIEAGLADPTCALPALDPPANCRGDAGSDATSDQEAPDAADDQTAPVDAGPDAPIETDADLEAGTDAPADAPTQTPSDAPSGG
jgi:hypothetical protein